MILLLFEQSEKEMAQNALLNMEVMLAATGVSWLKKGAEVYQKTWERFRRMAGVGGETKKPDDAKANRKNLAATFAKLGLLK